MRYKILSAEFGHETNTFNIHPTSIENFAKQMLLDGEQALAQRGQKNTELAGLLSMVTEQNWQLEHCFSATAGPGGKVTKAAFEQILAPLLERLTAPCDAVFLILHGAMVTDFSDDGEGAILERVRELVGPDVPIAMTLDPHANVTQKMCDLAQILVSYRTYPHVDMYDTGYRTAQILRRTLLAEIAPRTLRALRPMLEEINGGRTDIGPMIERQAMALDYEQQPDIYAVSVNGGFASADICELGPSVLICCEGDLDEHQAKAEHIADDIWQRRDEVLNNYYSCEQAAQLATDWHAKKGNQSEKGPMVIADYADNPGAGAYGDSTALLRALLNQPIDNGCFGPIVDGQAVAQLQDCPLGTQVSIDIGGKMAPTMGGGPLAVEAKIIWRGCGVVEGTGPVIKGLTIDFGPTVVLQVGGFEVLVVSIAKQILDLNQFQAFGIEPAQKSVVALKSMQHFRGAFEPIAGSVIVCDSGALCTLDYKSLGYQHVPRPIFPLDSM